MSFLTDSWTRNYAYGMIFHPAFIAPLAFLYALALEHGISNAHDDKRSFRERSPWIHLSLGTNRFLLLFALIVLPCLLMWLLIFLDTNDPEFWRDVFPYYTALYLAHMGVAGIAFSIITLLAPRLPMPLLLTAIGTLSGTVIWCSGWKVIVIPISKDYATAPIFFALLGVLGLLSFSSVWLYVRYRLNRAWFRFHETPCERQRSDSSD